MDCTGVHPAYKMEKIERRPEKDCSLTWLVNGSFCDKRNLLYYSYFQEKKKKRNKAKDVSVTSRITFKDLDVWL